MVAICPYVIHNTDTMRPLFLFSFSTARSKRSEIFHIKILNTVSLNSPFFFIFKQEKELNKKVSNKRRWHPVSFAILPLILPHVLEGPDWNVFEVEG